MLILFTFLFAVPSAKIYFDQQTQCYSCLKGYKFSSWRRPHKSNYNYVKEKRFLEEHRRWGTFHELILFWSCLEKCRLLWPEQLVLNNVKTFLSIHVSKEEKSFKNREQDHTFCSWITVFPSRLLMSIQSDAWKVAEWHVQTYRKGWSLDILLRAR